MKNFRSSKFGSTIESKHKHNHRVLTDLEIAAIKEEKQNEPLIVSRPDPGISETTSIQSRNAADENPQHSEFFEFMKAVAITQNIADFEEDGSPEKEESLMETINANDSCDYFSTFTDHQYCSREPQIVSDEILDDCGIVIELPKGHQTVKCHVLWDFLKENRPPLEQIPQPSEALNESGDFWNTETITIVHSEEIAGSRLKTIELEKSNYLRFTKDQMDLLDVSNCNVLNGIFYRLKGTHNIAIQIDLSKRNLIIIYGEKGRGFYRTAIYGKVPNDASVSSYIKQALNSMYIIADYHDVKFQLITRDRGPDIKSAIRKSLMSGVPTINCLGGLLMDIDNHFKNGFPVVKGDYSFSYIPTAPADFVQHHGLSMVKYFEHLSGEFSKVLNQIEPDKDSERHKVLKKLVDCLCSLHSKLMTTGLVDETERTFLEEVKEELNQWSSATIDETEIILLEEVKEWCSEVTVFSKLTDEIQKCIEFSVDGLNYGDCCVYEIEKRCDSHGIPISFNQKVAVLKHYPGQYHNISNLKYHYSEHTEKPQKNFESYICCELCGFLCVGKAEFRNHIQTNHIKHREMMESRTCICEICSKEIKLASVPYHKKSHSLPKRSTNFTGIANLGNSCYLNSVVQLIFSVPEFITSFVHHAFQIYVSIPLNAFNVQMANMGMALIRGKSKTLDKGNTQLTGVSLEKFKHTIANGHPAFSSNDQQDAHEYLLHLLNMVNSNNRNQENPVDALKFRIEDRVECASSGKVRYNYRDEWCLSLPVPLAAATNLDDVRKYEMEKEAAENEGRVMLPDSLVRPKISLRSCFEKFGENEIVEQFYSTAINDKTVANKRNRISTMPDYLMLHLKKFTMRQDWVAVKLDVSVDCPNELDLEFLRGTGILPNEQELPEKSKEPVDDAQLPHQNYRDGDSKYKLIAFISHMGTSAQVGHYLCHILKNNQWIKYDDANIEAVQVPLIELGYIYLYERITNLKF